MKLLYSVVLFGLLSLAFADGIPHPKEHRKGDHVKEEAHPGVDSNLHFKDGEHDADYDHKAFLDKEKEGTIPEEDDDIDDGDFDEPLDGDFDDEYDGYNDTYQDYPDYPDYNYNDTNYDYYNDFNETDYDGYNDTMDYDYPKNYQDDDDDDDDDDDVDYDDGGADPSYDDGTQDDYEPDLSRKDDSKYDDNDKTDDESDVKRKKRDVDDVKHLERKNENLEYVHTEGSEDEADEFKELDPDEAKKRLLVLAKRMDTDKSGDVSKDELQHWISNSFKSLDEADAKKQFDRQDKDKNGSVTWSEMLQEVYGYTPEEVAQHENDSSDEMKNFVQMTKDDRKKFDLADESGDGTLDFKEFVAYHNPHNFARMAPVEVEKTMRDYDKDKDGKISYTEYQQKDESEEAKEEDQAEMEKQFKSYDKNNDGHLDADEVKAWVIPAMDELSVEEAAHLFTEADKDKDGKLTMDEITDSHDLFVGSQATDYGDALQRMKEEL